MTSCQILLNCSVSTSSDKWNEIYEIVTGRHDLAPFQANIEKVSFVTSYSHVSDVMTSRYDISYANTKSMIFSNLTTQNTIETR